MKTDARKYTYYLESQAVRKACAKVQLRASETLSVPYLRLSRLSPRMIERMRPSLFTSFPPPPPPFPCTRSLPTIQLLFRTASPSLSYTPKLHESNWKNFSGADTHAHHKKYKHCWRSVFLQTPTPSLDLSEDF